MERRAFLKSVMMNDYDLKLLGFIVALQGSLLAVAVAVFNQLNASRARKLNILAYLDSRDKTIREWATDVVKEIDAAIALCEIDPRMREGGSVFNDRLKLKQNLSTLTDVGRWFFPNDSPEKYGTDKELAYKGLRPRVLDPIVASYRFVSTINYEDGDKNHGIRRDLIGEKKQFVSEVQIALDPRRRADARRAL